MHTQIYVAPDYYTLGQADNIRQKQAYAVTASLARVVLWAQGKDITALIGICRSKEASRETSLHASQL